MSKGRVYSETFKVEAIALVDAEHSVESVARQLGIPGGTLWNWVRRARGVKTPSFSPSSSADDPVAAATHRAALRRIAELERENEFLGKASAYFAQKVHPERSSTDSSRSNGQPTR